MRKILSITTLFTAIIFNPALAQCSFSFNATEAQIQQSYPNSSSTNLKFPSINGMKASYTVAANPDMGTKLNYYAKNGDGYTIPLPQTGIIAYEYQFKLPSFTISGEGNIVFLPTIGRGEGQDQSPFAILITYINNWDPGKNQNMLIAAVYNNTTSQGNGGGKSFDVNILPKGYQRLGIYINQDTKQVGMIFNGINYGYVGTASTKPVNYYFEMNLGQYAIPVGNSIIGQEISQELILDRSQLQFTYPAGTKDLCGAVL
ncbi:DUF4882 domain-containing protein [Acinetobacter suaedae]|uniref:DUF4882 domain-containing protein n=1 Tax=Acinetobacter suaedae TaxID=2609668 RepID=A0A5P1UTS7_9GAMM|nr:DUF4882 family protein [Acinetobacter sp. C16S1]QER40359.1 DUF4882 domain-containing protein [Acinetobacter sp. C16S1]